jgi:hypothetical protein
MHKNAYFSNNLQKLIIRFLFVCTSLERSLCHEENNDEDNIREVVDVCDNNISFVVVVVIEEKESKTSRKYTANLKNVKRKKVFPSLSRLLFLTEAKKNENAVQTCVCSCVSTVSILLKRSASSGSKEHRKRRSGHDNKEKGRK